MPACVGVDNVCVETYAGTYALLCSALTQISRRNRSHDSDIVTLPPMPAAPRAPCPLAHQYYEFIPLAYNLVDAFRARRRACEEMDEANLDLDQQVISTRSDLPSRSPRPSQQTTDPLILEVASLQVSQVLFGVYLIVAVGLQR